MASRLKPSFAVKLCLAAAALVCIAFLTYSAKIPRDYNISEVVLLSERDYIGADGKDTAWFTALLYNSYGELLNNYVSADIELYVNGALHSGMSLTATTTEKISVYCTAGGVKSNVVEIDGVFASNLPVAVLTKSNEKVSGTDKFIGELKIYDGGEHNTYINGKPAIVSKVLYSLRGKWSATFPKKQYNLTFVDDDLNELELDVLGMGADSQWIINAAYADKSLIRNYIAYKLGCEVMAAGTDCRLVEVFMDENGDGILSEREYYGVYIIVEKIKRGEGRVDVEKSGMDITGGYIIARDKVTPEDMYFTLPSEIYRKTHGTTFTFSHKMVYPSKSRITKEQFAYIENYVTMLDGKIKDLPNGINDYKNYLDIYSYADAVMMYEIFYNVDGYQFSTYFYKPIGGKLFSGPLWDFDLSLGNLKRGSNAEEFYVLNSEWTYYMLNDPAFVKALEDSYRKLRNGVFSDNYIYSFIDETVEMLKEGGIIERNYERFPELFDGSYNQSLGGIFIDTWSYEEEIEQMKDFLARRLEWLDSEIYRLEDHYDFIKK